MNQTPDHQQSLFLLENKIEVQAHLVKMLAQGRKDLSIFSHALDPALFDCNAIRVAISKLARQSRHANIRIIVEDVKRLVDLKHSLLDLAQRLPNAITIKKLTIAPHHPYQFMLVDEDKIWLQRNLETYSWSK